MRGQKILYQFGNYVFKRVNLETNIGGKNKLVRDGGAIAHGTSRSRGKQANFKDDYPLSVTFEIGEEENINSILRDQFADIQKIYWVSKDRNLKYHFHFTYAEVESAIPQIYSYKGNYGYDTKKMNETTQIVQVTFKLIQPFIYELTEEVYLQDISKLTNTLDQYIGNATIGSWTLGSRDLVINQDVINASIPTNETYFDPIIPQYRLYSIDRYLNLDSNLNVKNLLDYTEDFTNAAWIKNGVTISALQTDKYGTNRASQLTFSATNKSINQYYPVSYSFVNTYNQTLSYTASVWVKGTAGQTIAVEMFTVKASPYTRYQSAGGLVTLTGNWQQVARTITIDGTSSNMTGVEFWIDTYSSATATVITVQNPQLEQGTNATTYQAIFTTGPQYYDLNPTEAFAYTLTSNTGTALSSLPMNLYSSAKNLTNIIKIGQLQQNEWVSIFNSSTNTGVKVTWLSAIASPVNLLIYTHKNGYAIDPITGIEYSDATLGNMSIQPLGNGYLQFSNREELDPINSPLVTPPADALVLNKSTTGNQTIIIKTLKTQH